ncbi:Glutamyl-tRNA synthetase [Halocaridina rubra]|uniref:Nondiscriminating glutamyl-tRNA synthetase EARS2, mitochondrial n=1 Tax=Halocaridina rubra TaxID=373956 RepID=A0AAN8ZYN6_HALRR
MPWHMLKHHRSRTLKMLILLKEYCYVQKTVTARNFHSEIRVRFAPSPTGYLHLGGLRTALYNYLFARSNGGKFILRIEDTDQTRLVTKAAERLESILKWAEINADESPIVGGSVGPYVQSQRIDIYQDHVDKLLENGTAYKCFCTEMRLNLLKKDLQRRGETMKYDNRCRHLSSDKIMKLEATLTPYCIRFKLEDIQEPFQDLVYGPILNNIAEQEGDPIILKTDGYPTYHFANVVDDHLMGISHVLRGVEWQVSTPKHLLLYKAFGWDPPKFGHLPLIKNSDGTKLSKRQGDLHVETLKSKGYSAKSVLNFVTNIGGGFDDKEHNLLHSIEELVEKFNLGRINPNSCKLEMEKLLQFSQMDLLQQLENPVKMNILVKKLQVLLQDTYGEKLASNVIREEVLSPENIKKILLWSRNRICKVEDLLTEEFSYIWVVPQDLSLDKLAAMPFSPVNVLSSLIDKVSSIPDDDFSAEVISRNVRAVGKNNGLKVPAIMSLVRRSVSGLKQGPPVGEMLEILGKESSIERLKHARSLLL